MDLRFNQDALKAVDTDAGLVSFVSHLGEQVAARANARAAALFTDQGGGGVGSIESHVEHDERGPFAHVGYPRQYFYMNIHEVGSEHEKPRPHLRPALYGTKAATGGKTSAIKRVKQNKSAQQTTKKNRDAAKARRTTKRSNGG